MCVSLYKLCGTTMAGLKAIGYKIDYDDFHSFVHGRLPYDMLKPDPVLRNLLLSLPIRKVIFTNADETHARRVLSRLGLEDCFERIISFDTLNPTDKGIVRADDDGTNSSGLESSTISTAGISDINDYPHPNNDLELPKTSVVCKPSEEAFEQVFRIANIDPQRTLFFDDSIRNIQTGNRMGLHTVWVGKSCRVEGVDYALESIHNIREALPELWEADDKSDSIVYSGQVAIETWVEA